MNRNRKWIVLGAALLLAAGFFAGHVVAEEGEMEMQQPEWAKHTAEHAQMKKYVGTWDAVMDWGMGKAEKGEATWTLLHNGNYLMQQFKGVSMGKAYTGTLLLGYDTIDKQWVSAWTDNWNPCMFISTGNDKDGMTGKGPNPMAAGKMTMTLKTTWESDDKYTMHFFGVVNGKEAPMGKIVYTRRK